MLVYCEWSRMRCTHISAFTCTCTCIVYACIYQVNVLYPQEALSIIEPMLSDPVPFVQQV